jgi:hypothetical protein
MLGYMQNIDELVDGLEFINLNVGFCGEKW